MTPEKERQSREHMDVIYKTIIRSGLARDDQIVFVSVRGGSLNSTLKNNYSATGYNFKLYGPTGTGTGAQEPIFPSLHENGENEMLTMKLAIHNKYSIELVYSLHRCCTGSGWSGFCLTNTYTQLNPTQFYVTMPHSVQLDLYAKEDNECITLL